MGTFFQPVRAQNDSKIDTKMAPKGHQNGPKMASWRVLGPFGGQVGPKMEPRGFQGRKSRFVPPMLGAKLGPHFSHFHHQGGSKEAWRPSWMTCCVQTPIFRRKGVSRDMEKQAKPLECCSFLGFPPTWKKLLWRGVWGSILGAFWVPSWAMLGTKLAYKGS